MDQMTAISDLARRAFPNVEAREMTCPDHGPYQAVRYLLGQDFTPCPGCVAEHETIRAASAQAAGVKARLKSSGVATRFLDKGFDDFETTRESEPILERVREYASNFAAARAAGRCLILAGQPGTGKNHLAAGLIREVLAQGFSARQVEAYTLLARFKATWRKESTESEAEVLAAYQSPDLLVLDEVGVQFGSEAEKVILFNVFNARYNDVKPTVLLSNEDREGIESYLGDRVVDRMRESGGRLLTLDWPSHRGKR